MKRPTRGDAAPPERRMTADDWKALYLLHQAAEQVVLHGAGALDAFVDGIAEARKEKAGHRPNGPL